MERRWHRGGSFTATEALPLLPRFRGEVAAAKAVSPLRGRNRLPPAEAEGEGFAERRMVPERSGGTEGAMGMPIDQEVRHVTSSPLGAPGRRESPTDDARALGRIPDPESYAMAPIRP